MSEWKEYKLGDIAEVIGGGTPNTSNDKYWGGDIPRLSPKDLTGYNRIYIKKGERNITEQGLNNSSTRLLPSGTVLFSSRAPIGYVAIAGNPICTNQGFKSFVCDKTKVYNVFLYYWLKNNTEYLQSLGTGTTFAELSGSALKKVDISLPPLEEQKRIAGILSSLDDKIDLLNRENATLEALAETLFRHYFIDNPNPEWKEGKLGDLISICSGKSLNRSEFSEVGLYPVYGANGIIGGTNSYLVDENDALLFTGRVGTLGNVFRLRKEKAWMSDNTLIIRPKKYYNYVYFLLKQANLKDYNVGSTQPLIRQTDICDIDVCNPADNLMDVFENATAVYFDEIYANKKQIQTLTTQRDTLLPRLMSGEVHVE